MGFITFHTALKPLLLTGKIFGMVPFSIWKHGYKISKIGISYNVLFLLLYTSAFIYTILKDITNPTKMELLLHTISTLQNLAGFGVTMVVWISSLVNQKKYILALNKIGEIDKSFKTLGIWMYYEKVRRISIAMIIIALVYVFISLGTEATLYFETLYVKNFLKHTLYNVPLAIYSILTIQVYIYLRLLKDRYVILNQHLKELQKYECQTISVVEVKNLKLTSPLGTKLSLLRLICPLHHELCKAANIFDSIFGINLLVTFGNSFVAITTYMYLIISRLKTFNSETTGFEILSIMGPFTLNIIETIWLCWICHATVEEVRGWFFIGVGL